MTRIFSYLKKVIGRMDLCSSLALLIFVSVSLTVASAITPLDGEAELYSGTIRFHVIANSDTGSDQALKLLVRDRVTEYTSELLCDVSTMEEALKLLSENSLAINAIAREVISKNGYSYDVSTRIGYEFYPERQYDKYRFPAGKYCSLRINIGKAEGKNWWCVLFPPMCIGSAVKEEYTDSTELEGIGFSDDQIRIIDEPTNIKKEIRFFFLDKFKKRK